MMGTYLQQNLQKFLFFSSSYELQPLHLHLHIVQHGWFDHIPHTHRNLLQRHIHVIKAYINVNST